MKVYDIERGVGKTSYMVHLSNLLGYPILCANNAHVDAVISRAKEFNLSIPMPINAASTRGLNLANEKYDSVLIDELELVLRELFKKLNVDFKIRAATYSSNPYDSSRVDEYLKSQSEVSAYAKIKELIQNSPPINESDTEKILQKIGSIIDETEKN